MLHRDHSSGPNLTLSIEDGVFGYLIAAAWQEKTASDLSGPSDSGKPPPRTAPTQSLRNVPTPQPRGRVPGTGLGAGRLPSQDGRCFWDFKRRGVE